MALVANDADEVNAIKEAIRAAMARSGIRRKARIYKEDTKDIAGFNPGGIDPA